MPDKEKEEYSFILYTIEATFEIFDEYSHKFGAEKYNRKENLTEWNTHNNNITTSDIIYTFDAIDTSGTLKNIITIGGVEMKNVNLYIGNTYVFNQSNNNSNQQIIFSKKRLEYNRNKTGSSLKSNYVVGLYKYKSGRIAIEDIDTDWSMNVTSFGSKNAQIFASMFKKKEGEK